MTFYYFPNGNNFDLSLLGFRFPRSPSVTLVGFATSSTVLPLPLPLLEAELISRRAKTRRRRRDLVASAMTSTRRGGLGESAEACTPIIPLGEPGRRRVASLGRPGLPYSTVYRYTYRGGGNDLPKFERTTAYSFRARLHSCIYHPCFRYR